MKVILLNLLPVLILSSCLETEDEFIEVEAEIKQLLESKNFQLEKIDRKTNYGLKVSDIIEFEQAIKLFKGEDFDSLIMDRVLLQNDLEMIPSFNRIKFEVIDVESVIKEKILCLDNWRQVYGRIGVGSGPTWIDLSFQIGTGTGLIANFDAVLSGLTFMTGLGKNNFVNSQIASAGNNYSYSGIYSLFDKICSFR
ncbi:hypothetical protein [Algoriphagus namhaensis]